MNLFADPCMINSSISDQDLQRDPVLGPNLCAMRYGPGCVIAPNSKSLCAELCRGAHRDITRTEHVLDKC